MLGSYVTLDSFLQFLERSSLGSFREHGVMNILGRVLSSPAHDDVIAILIPLEHGPGSDPELTPDLHGNRDLTLGGNL
jgi:hypothetical protein